MGKSILATLLSLLAAGSVHAQETRLMLPLGHNMPVISARFSLDAKKIISISKHGRPTTSTRRSSA